MGISRHTFNTNYFVNNTLDLKMKPPPHVSSYVNTVKFTHLQTMQDNTCSTVGKDKKELKLQSWSSLIIGYWTFTRASLYIHLILIILSIILRFEGKISISDNDINSEIDIIVSVSCSGYFWNISRISITNFNKLEFQAATRPLFQASPAGFHLTVLAQQKWSWQSRI